MTTAAELPYGSWPTPITSELVVRAARLPTGVQLDGNDLWWSESRPEEGGRTTLLRREPDGSAWDVLSEPWNARSGVHEYGGGAWWVRRGVLWFVDWATQRIHRLAPDDEPVPLTPEPDEPRGLRYADGDVRPDGLTMLCVQEEHHADGSPATNTIVWLDATAPSEPVVIVEGPDFVSDPRWRPDGGAFCWLEWDQPDMPWDANRLVVDEGGFRSVVAGGDRRESICQPTWAADGSLWFTSDRTGFWSLYRWRRARGVELVLDVERDIGFPQWVFGQRCFALLEGDRVAFVYQDGGVDHLAVRNADDTVYAADVGATAIDSLTARGDELVFLAGSPTAEVHVARMWVPGGPVPTEPDVDVVVPPRDLGLDPAWFSVPVPFDFTTRGGVIAHSLLYRPANPEAEGPPDRRPPLLVLIHGGPTSAARPLLRLSTQYWTSRGFAVVDVNYRGSTGYGRAYRELLDGAWGVADVQDCVAVALALVTAGEADPDRLAIRGGSAGGFTTLAALAFHDVFAAGASHYGVADLGLLATDTHKFEARYLDGLVGPWPEARATYEERSPLYHLQGINKPLAVFQGLEDAVVPPNQAELIVEGLRDRGILVAYLPFEGEGHGFRRSENIRAALDGELSFYAQILGFDLPPDEAIEPIEIR